MNFGNRKYQSLVRDDQSNIFKLAYFNLLMWYWGYVVIFYNINSSILLVNHCSFFTNFFFFKSEFCPTYWTELLLEFVQRFQMQCLSKPTQLRTVKKDYKKRNTFKQQEILHWLKYLPTRYSSTLEHLKSDYFVSKGIYAFSSSFKPPMTI